MKAQAIEFSAPRAVRVVPRDLPDPRPGEVMVRTLYSGISGGTETLAFNGLIDPEMVLDESIPSLEGSFKFPFRYGYSCVGVIEAAVENFDEGQQVFCMHPHQSVLVRPAEEMIPVDGLEPRIATMLPLVETGFQIALDAGTPAGPVLVFGLGPVGITAAAVLKQRGVEVTGVEPIRSRRDAAGAFGIETVPPEEALSGVSMVIECSGRPEVLAGSLDLLTHEGSALVASWYGKKPVELPLGGAFHRRRLTIKSTQVSSIPRALQDEWTFEKRTAAAVDLMKELPLEGLATHTFPLHDAQRAFEAADSAADGLIHAALSYE